MSDQPNWIGKALLGIAGDARNVSPTLADKDATIATLSARVAELEGALVEKRRDRIGDSEISGSYLCRAEAAEARITEPDERLSEQHVAEEGTATMADTVPVWIAVAAEVRRRNRIGEEGERGAIATSCEGAATDLVLNALAACGFEVVPAVRITELEGENMAFRSEMDRLQTKAMGAVDRARELEAELASLKAAPTDAEVDAAGIYIASKTKHGPRWQELRTAGVPIISTWIDEYYPGATEDWQGLWVRCVHEASTARALVLYREPDEVLKGAWVEVGAALARGVPVFAVGIDEFSTRHHPGITLCADLDEAMRAALIAAKEAR